LKILAGVYAPNKGSVRISGKLVPFIELGVGFNPELSGKDNVYLNGAMLGFSVKEINEMYKDIVEFAELERFMDQKLKYYSSGMQVRLAFSMATRSKADILLVDEVLAVGDADFQRKCFNYFKKLKKNNVTVVFVSHDMSSVIEFCDRAALIDNNEIVNIGDTKTITQQYSRLFVDDIIEEKIEINKNRNNIDLPIFFEHAFINKNKFIDKDSEIIVSARIVAKATHNNLVTGYRVRNSAGQTVNETNTSLEKIKNLEVHSESSLEIEWKIPNIYSDGTYTVDLYLYGAKNQLYDNWDEAIEFEVRRPEARGFIVKIPSKFRLKR